VIKVEIGVRIRKDQASFLNPTIPVSESKRKWNKVVDCRRLNAEQQQIHCRMNETEVVQESTMEEDWESSHDFTNAFTKMLVDKEHGTYLTFSRRGEY
jgi:hypothetical protein